MVRLKVKGIAREQGLDMVALSRRSEVSYGTVFKLWHNRHKDVSLSTLEKIAQALDVRICDLIHDIDDT